MTKLVAAVLLAASAVAFAPAASAKCAMAHLKYQTVTAAPIGPGGGILVATVEAPYDDRSADADADNRPAWSIEADGKVAAATYEALAPGLFVYALPAGATSAKLYDGKLVRASVTTTKDKAATLPAPKLVKANLDKALGRRPYAITTVTLDAKPPAGAVALVLADSKGTARSFGLVETGATNEIVVYRHTRCGVVPNDTVEAARGDKVLVFWVDGGGRRSASSNVVSVGGKAPRASDDD